MRPFIIILMVSFVLFNVSCSKDKTPESFRSCWQLVDFAGNKIGQVCDKTEDELVDCVNNNTCGPFSTSVQTPLNSCYYYKVESDTFCWFINDSTVIKNFTESQAQWMARCHFNNGRLTKINCADCEQWYNREKRIYKPTGFVSYSVISGKYYCYDTLATIYQGREIVKKDDVDSLIVIQFSNDRMHW
jgi:hypothetical protein